MSEILGGIEAALGAAINAIYQATHSYALAIILLTVAVRALLIPLTVKQIRSMTSMQKLGPEQKKIQQKYKELQKKAQDRTEVQQIRMQMNQEVQGLFKKHNVNPLGGCLPLVAQFPVFIAMIAIVRASIIAVPTSVTLVSGAAVPADIFAGTEIKSVLCRPYDVEEARSVEPNASGRSPKAISCPTSKGDKIFLVDGFREPKHDDQPLSNAGWITLCRPSIKDGSVSFQCQSALGTGHLPRDGKLFSDVTADRATVFGMHPGCTPNQAASKPGMRECTVRDAKGGQTQAIPYYLLVLLIVGTQYYQSKQMAARATGQMAQQQQMMTRIFPVFFGFISLSFPTGANLYFLAQNVWTIGQQHILLKRQDEAGAREEAELKQAKRGSTSSTPKQQEAQVNGKTPVTKPSPSASKKKKRKKKR
ncbi:MAG: YidC/Oxa1 family membrane protein insertase [Actinomycetota bacterium]